MDVKMITIHTPINKKYVATSSEKQTIDKWKTPTRLGEKEQFLFINQVCISKLHPNLLSKKMLFFRSVRIY